MPDKKTVEKHTGGVMVKMTADLCEQYHSTLAEYYYKNMKACDFTETYTYAVAESKMKELATYLKEGKALVFGYFVDKELVGYIWGYLHRFREEQRIYVSEIYVLEKWRSQGIGKQLLNEIEKEAEVRRIKALYIHAEAGNERAIKLYKKEGFKIERLQLRKSLQKDKDQRVQVFQEGEVWN